jgi:ubiquinone/menaquinone biosynthesis C-methylase UbiE
MNEKQVQQEFNLWADRGQGQAMESGHGDVTRQALDRVDFSKIHSAFDAGCGSGWAVRLMKELGARTVVGADLSGRMLKNAPQASGCHYVQSSSAALPFPDASFELILSVEALYYVEKIDLAVAEFRRVCAPDGRVSCIVDLFRENPGSQGWVEALKVPAHLLSEKEYVDLFTNAGFHLVQPVRLVDRRPLKPESEFEADEWFPTYGHYVEFKQVGSLLIEAIA